MRDPGLGALVCATSCAVGDHDQHFLCVAPAPASGRVQNLVRQAHCEPRRRVPPPTTRVRQRNSRRPRRAYRRVCRAWARAGNVRGRIFQTLSDKLQRSALACRHCARMCQGCCVGTKYTGWARCMRVPSPFPGVPLPGPFLDVVECTHVLSTMASLSSFRALDFELVRGRKVAAPPDTSPSAWLAARSPWRLPGRQQCPTRTRSLPLASLRGPSFSVTDLKGR